MSRPDIRSLECIVLPVGPCDWLLPAVCVAEIVRYQPLAKVTGPQACIGLLGWNDGDVPVVDLGLAAADPHPITHVRAIAVLNRTIADSPWPFWAMVLSGLPRRRRVSATMISRSESAAPVCPGSCVHAGAEEFLIPELGWLQRDQLPPVTWAEQGMS